MIKCPSCNHENVAGTTFCEMCGEELSATGSASTPAADASVASTPAASSGDIKCPACENLNPRENAVCEVCGTELHPASGDANAVASIPATAPTPDNAAAPANAATDAASSTPATTTLNDAAPTAPSTPDADAPAASDAGGDDASTPALSTAPAPAIALHPGMAKLVVEQGMSIGKQFALGDAEMQVGREDEEEDIYPDIDLADQDEGYVHRKHATLKFENDQLLVTHLGGANKTRVNNKPVPDNTPTAVKLGDKIAFGKVVLRLLPL